VIGHILVFQQLIGCEVAAPGAAGQAHGLSVGVRVVDGRSGDIGVLHAAEQLVEDVATQVVVDVVRVAEEFQFTDAGEVVVVVRLLDVWQVRLTAPDNHSW